MNTVKRLVAYLLLNDLSRYNGEIPFNRIVSNIHLLDIDIFCNNELMGRDYRYRGIFNLTTQRLVKHVVHPENKVK